MINTHEVHKVNTNSTARTVRNSILSLATVVAFSLPLAVSAGATGSADGNRSLLNSEWKLEVSNEPEAVYGKLKSRSRKVCGSSSRYITGDLRRSAQVDECYQGTLDAAVLRLDNAEVIALHQN
jgi:UrcA family protein